MGLSSTKEERLALMHVSNHNEIALADGWQFRGTKCAWTGDNVFRSKLTQQYEKGISLTYRCPFNFCFAITYGIVGIPLLALMFVIIGILTLFKMCCCRGGGVDGAEG